MKRHLLNLTTAVSLTLTLVAAWFWVRSYACGDSLGYRRSPWQLDVLSDRGSIFAAWGTLVSENYPVPEGWQGSFWPFERHGDIRVETNRPLGMLRFEFNRVKRSSPGYAEDTTDLVIPWWVICVPLLIVSAGLSVNTWRRVRRAHRRSRGRCAACGYDLSGNVSGVCPECGTAITGGKAVVT